jgi:hypothetical protein
VSAWAARTPAVVARIPLVCIVQSVISPALAWARGLAGARAAEARGAGTRIRDGGNDSAGDGRVARQWRAEKPEGGMTA